MDERSPSPERKLPAKEKYARFDAIAPIDDDPEWSPGFRQQFPWFGVGGFLMVFVGLAVATSVLSNSHGKRVADWPITGLTSTPNVFINLANLFSSFGMITAVQQGLTIVWWRSALRGSTLRDLHYDYTYGAYGASFVTTLASGKRFNIITLAALMTKATVIDSTLFQKSTSTALKYAQNYDTIHVNGWVAHEWPQGRGGIPVSDGSIGTFDKRFADIVTAFHTKIGNSKVHDTQQSFTGCPAAQSCEGSLEALGFSFDCSVTVENVDYGSSMQSNALLWSIDFSPQWPTSEKNYSSIMMQMSYINSEDGPSRSCPGTLTTRKCNIRPATVRYPLLIQAADPNQSVNVTHLGYTNPAKVESPFNTDMKLSQIDEIRIVNYNDLFESQGHRSTVGAIAFSLNNLFKSHASLNMSVTSKWSLSVTGSRAQSYFYAKDSVDIKESCGYKLDQTASNQPDPFITLLRDINSYAFVSALYLNGAPTIPAIDRPKAGLNSQRLLVSVSGYGEHYKTNFRLVAAGIVATLLSVLCVLPVYYGFWDLGRNVTLEPLEIARALRAPLLVDSTTRSGDIEKVIEELGDRRVRYGRTVESRSGGLVLGEAHLIMPPQVKGYRPLET